MPKNFFACLLIVVITLTSTLLFAEDSNKSLNVTVYNNDLGVIRDTRDIDLKTGINQIKITDVAQKIDPTSVHIKIPGRVLEQNYQYDLVSFTKILEKYIDKEIILSGENVISGTLLSISGNNIVLKNKDGGLILLPKIDNYKINVGALPEGLITRPTLIWTVDAQKSGKQEAELSYQTGGMNWHAEYVAVLNESDTKTDLNSWVSIDNQSGATYKDAKLKLVAGDVNRVQENNIPVYMKSRVKADMAMGAEEQFQEKEFFEYHMYDLQRPATIADNETKQISLFEASDININKKFLYRSGGYAPWNSGPPNKVAVVIEFENKKQNNLGIPLPKGKVRLYKSDGKSIEFIGEDMIDHTPKDEKIKLKVGDAFDILAEEIEKEQNRISDKVYEYTYQVKLKNRKKENITVEVERSLGYNWEILSETVKHESKDSRTVVFKVPVGKESETTLEFKVRYSW